MFFVVILLFRYVLSENIIWIDSVNGNNDNIGSEDLPKKTLDAALAYGFMFSFEVYIQFLLGDYFVSGTTLVDCSLHLRSDNDSKVVCNSKQYSCFYLNDSFLKSNGVIFVFDNITPPLLHFVGTGVSVASGLKIVVQEKIGTLGNVVIIIENGCGVLKDISFIDIRIHVTDDSLCGIVVLKDLVKGLTCLDCSFYRNIIDCQKGSAVFVCGETVRKFVIICIEIY
jgi:hypothetical protein